MPAGLHAFMPLSLLYPLCAQALCLDVYGLPVFVLWDFVLVYPCVYGPLCVCTFVRASLRVCGSLCLQAFVHADLQACSTFGYIIG